ncbi:MAG: four helix bundle protein [Ignavibacteria bacterium]|nr:four helix bundle protein [Ignavibacteria bacterium]MCC7159949.1 four helix bundle protein [Ignavibacteria bacterium]
MGFNDEFRERTKQFALRIIKLFRSLPKTDEARVIGKQLLRSGCSVGANFRAATRVRSKAEFNSKLSIVVEEADETSFWMELLIESGIVSESKLSSLYKESIEITKIMAVSRKTAKNNK